MANEKWKIDPALRFAYKYKVSPAVLKTMYRLRYSEILGKKRNKLMPYEMIALTTKERFNLDISERVIRYWIKQVEEYRFKSK